MAASKISKELRALASPEAAAILQRFFKTGAGQYGAGDVFLGIKVPPLRALAKQHRDADINTIGVLLDSSYHEERLFALLLLMQVGGRRTGGLSLERFVHPFMPAVLLRPAGRDPLRSDPELYPPGGQAA